MASTLSTLTPGNALAQIDQVGRENPKLWIPVGLLGAVGVGEIFKSLAGCRTECDDKKKKKKEKTSLGKRLYGAAYVALVAGLIYATWRLRDSARKQEAERQLAAVGL